MANTWWIDLCENWFFAPMRGKCHSIFKRPILTVQSFGEGTGIYAYSFCPNSHGQGFVAKCNDMIKGGILRLFLHRNPKAIRGFIVAIYVLAFYGIAFGTSSHIGNEVGKFFPFRTNRYSPSAVMGEPIMLRVLTALKHVSPNHIRFGLTPVLSSCVGYISHSTNIPNETATAMNFSDIKHMGCCEMFIPTIAFTKPKAGIPSFTFKSYNGKSPKFLSDKISIHAKYNIVLRRGVRQ